LIVLDLAMPFMDGVTALEEMRRSPKSRTVPVVVVTALTDPALHQQVRDLGAVAVITKPFEHWELADAVRLVLAGDELRSPAAPAEPLDS
jgi:CheY-like chemotaxis protein